MSKRASQARALEQKYFTILSIFAGVAALLVIVGFVSKPPALDSDGCPESPSKRLKKAAVLLIDTTDELNGMRADNVKTMARDIAKQMDQYERLSVFVLNADTTAELRPVFSKCTEGNGSALDFLYKGNRDRSAGKDAKFESELSNVLDAEMAKQHSAKATPLFESIRDMRQSQYWAEHTSFYLISDLMEHSGVVSLYDRNANFDKSSQTSSGQMLKNINLDGTSVEYCVIERPANSSEFAAQENARIFWQMFFEDSKSCAFELCQPTKNEFFNKNKCARGKT
ncbi:MAG: hypothetical protein EOP05_01190 [Proteobacteria bacterium]|nr:MAG: hypothetical protein EOP05_01190 [Pseudomonadota bacterium]